ncbi:HAD family hydrolase [Paenibacillus thalictri]|uniref:HAD family phosphatase n=1 Tax=Paenibacillus thalictri TaxID=2527873 RepID=A0A4Q9DJY9_9BACL|nr:Cof-type HAD-IIB family hydrolase [Paenibacillus thalictri]TBL71398.1 HAD family phosphatase [Paenibacillus thalictri]
MNGIKLVALDLDGTLLNEHHQVSEENRKAIGEARAQGVTVIVATGREVNSARPYWESLELDSPLIAANGSEVWDAAGRLHKRHTLNAETVAALYEIAAAEDCPFWGYTTEGEVKKDTWAASVNDQTVWLKFGYFSADQSKLERVRERAQTLGAMEITNSHPSNIEINPQGVSKASAIRDVCGLYDLKMEQVMAVGDSLNDRAMLLAAGIGVAMGNAQEEVKRLANAVTGSNREHGVAQAIRRFVLK